MLEKLNLSFEEYAAQAEAERKVRLELELTVIRKITDSGRNPDTGEELLYLNPQRAFKFINLELERYPKTNGVKHATLDGKKIENASAKSLIKNARTLIYIPSLHIWLNKVNTPLWELISKKIVETVKKQMEEKAHEHRQNQEFHEAVNSPQNRG